MNTFMGLEMKSPNRPRLILCDFVTAWRRVELNAISSAIMMIAKDVGAVARLVSVEWIQWRGGRDCEILPPISSISVKERFSGVPLHSRALMPKRDVKKDSGRKLQLLARPAPVWYAYRTSHMTVKMVNTISDRD